MEVLSVHFDVISVTFCRYHFDVTTVHWEISNRLEIYNYYDKHTAHKMLVISKWMPSICVWDCDNKIWLIEAEVIPGIWIKIH